MREEGMRNSSLVPKLGKDAAALRMNGIGDCFPASSLLAIACSPWGEGSHHHSVGWQEVTEPAWLQQWLGKLHR